jgi:hypothetical protein
MMGRITKEGPARRNKETPNGPATGLFIRLSPAQRQQAITAKSRSKAISIKFAPLSHPGRQKSRISNASIADPKATRKSGRAISPAGDGTKSIVVRTRRLVPHLEQNAEESSFSNRQDGHLFIFVVLSREGLFAMMNAE